MSIALTIGWNTIVYTGKAQSAEDAFASIISYIKEVYYWDKLTGAYGLVITTTTMVPYRAYWIDVTQDCIWTYGVEETAPSSVYLYSGTNMASYCGEAISPAEAFASILSYLDTGHWIAYFNNVTKEYELVAIFQGGVWVFPQDLMVPNGVYFIEVTQNCEWVFEVEAVVPCSIFIDAPDSAGEGETVNVSATIRNVLPYHYSYKTEIYAGGTLIFSTDEVITSGSSKTYTASFVMPGGDITILVWVERWSVDYWAYDNAESKLVTLEVPEEYYTLDVIVEPPEAGYVTRSPVDIEYISGTRVTLTAKAYSGYQFVGWGGDASGTSPTVYITMNSNKVVVASFVLIVEEFAGTISRKELEYDHVRESIPVY